MIKHIIKLFFLFAFTQSLYGIEVDKSSSNIDILSHAYIFIDKTNTISKEKLKEKDFIKNDKAILGFGFVENYALWIRFTLKNTTDKTLIKFLEYDNPETEDIYYYDGDNPIVDGMFHIAPSRNSLNPNFKIELAPYEERTFYIKAHCKMSTLIAKLILWNEDELIKHNYRHKMVLVSFFTVIFTLLLYNFMLFIFTKDKAYLYYVLYLLSVIIFQSIYLGVAQLYIFSNALSVLVTKGTFTYISLLVIPIVLFTREFLNLHRFPKIDKFLKYYLLLILVFCILSFNNFIFNLDIIIIFIPIGIALIWAAIYAYYRGEKQAKFYIAGWSFLIISLVLSVLRSLGGFDITEYFLYVNEIAFALEALLFSVALADRIKILSEQKNEADAKLIAYQKVEQSRLEKLVDLKTLKLKAALSEKELLYKELHHRVKNNIQMIVSLVKLQISNTNSLETKKELEVTKSRIYSIMHLYEILSLTNQKLSSYSYIEGIASNIEHQKDIKIHYSILYEPDVSKLLYIGLIINELITNAIKYAFASEGNIYINMFKKGQIVYLIVKDDGVGFEMEMVNSLGSDIVKTLVEKQLFGSISIVSTDGVSIEIRWEDDA